MRDHTEREREGNPLQPLTDVEDAPRDAQPARFEHPDP